MAERSQEEAQLPFLFEEEADSSLSERETSRRAPPECLTIGLINNMPDATLEATERQFSTLLRSAAQNHSVRLRFFSLPEIARSADLAMRVRTLYENLDVLLRDRFDGLIITGCEPKAASLTDEPYWQSLARIIDWAEHNTYSTIFSCLAAHAAVHHLDGIKRSPLASKCSGIFDCVTVTDHPLLKNIASPMPMPHSRMNDLREKDLIAHGYQVLTCSAKAGVDLFVKEWKSLFVFFQGHPEYEADTLLKEYRRDVRRFLRFERSTLPPIPDGYFDEVTTEALKAFSLRAETGRRESLFRELSDELAGRTPDDRWHGTAVTIYQNWLNELAARKRRSD